MFHLGSVQELISSWASLSLSPCLCHWIMAAVSKIFCSACGSFFFFFQKRVFFFYWKKLCKNLTRGLWKSAISYFKLPWAHLCLLYQKVAELRCVFHSRLLQPCCHSSFFGAEPQRRPALIFFFWTFHLLLPWCFKSFEMTASVLDITWPSLTGPLWNLVFDKPGLSDPNFWNCDSEMKLDLGAGWGIFQKAF